jgi:hypothetical protein
MRKKLSRARKWRSLFVLTLVVLLSASLLTARTQMGDAASSGGTSGAKTAESLPTPPPSFNCLSYGSALAVTSPPHAITVPASGIVGTEFTLEGSGYYTGPSGSFTIWMANYTGGSLLQLASIPSPAPEPFTVTVTVPSVVDTTPFPTGQYEFWSLNESTVDPGCANAAFNLTGVPPPSIGCLSWTAQLQVTSPVPANGTAGTPAGLQGSGFSLTGDTTIYWANATGSPDVNVGTTPTNSPDGTFDTTIDVPSGYAAGLFVFWAIDGESDCAGAIFNLTGGPQIAVSPSVGSLGYMVTVAGSGFSASDTSISITGAVLAITLPCTLSAGSITGSCFFDVTGGLPQGPYTITGVGNIVGGPGDTATATFTMTPSIAVVPNTGTTLATFTVLGSGFSAFPSAAVVDFDGQLITPTGGSSCNFDGEPQITLNSAGNFECTYAVPPWATLGVNNLQGDDTFSGDLSNNATFTIPQLTIGAPFASGPAGTPANVTGLYWPLGDTILLQFAPVGDSSSTTTLNCLGLTNGEPVVNATGGFTCSFPIPMVTAGAYSALAIDQSVNPGGFGPSAIVSSTNTFTVTTPYVGSVSSTVGEPKPITFTVGGLAPNTPYFVYLDAAKGVLSEAPYNPLTTCTASASGVISNCMVPVPSDLIPGTYYVDLYQDPSPPPFIFSVVNFTVTSPPPASGHSSTSGLTNLDYELIGAAVLGLVVIVAAVALVRRRRKARPAPASSPSSTKSGGPPRPS